MDDDNDFQSQKFQLVGEENSRSPQTLRSFTFPKFDIDDHLQVHLRFDSLVEAEVFDIQSQESHWIEEFSSQSNGIGFSSAVVEPCSIPRDINVWSEATSSESVEMLLNSVREDEMVNQNIIKEELETQAMDDCTDRTVDALDTGPVSHDKSGKIIDLSEGRVINKLQNVGTSEISTGEKEENKIEECLVGEKIQSSKELAADVLMVDGNSPLSLKVDANECSVVDKICPEADKSLNFESMIDNAPDVHACDEKADSNELNSNSLTGMIIKDRPQNDLACDVKTYSNDFNADLTGLITKDGCTVASVDTEYVDTQNLSTNSVMDKPNEIDTGEKPDVLPVECMENLADQFPTSGNIQDDNVNNHNHSSEIVMNVSSLETHDSLPLLIEESNRAVFPQSSDGLLESIAYPAKIFGIEKSSDEEILRNTEELHSVAVFGNAGSENKLIDSTKGFSVQVPERESSRHRGNGNEHETIPINSLEMVNLGEGKEQTPIKAPVGKEEQKIVLSESSCGNLTSPGCIGSTEENKSIDNMKNFSLQHSESERLPFSSERHVRDENQQEPIPINSLVLVNSGEEKDLTLMKAPVDKGLKISDDNCGNLTQSTEKTDVLDFDTCRQDSNRLESSIVENYGPQDSSSLVSSVVQKNGDGCTEDIPSISAKPETVQHILEKSSLLPADAENSTPTCQKGVQMSDTVISLTDGSKVTEIQGELLIPLKDFTKETGGPWNNESSANVSIETPSIVKVVDSLDELYDGKPGGTCSSSPPSSKMLQQVHSDEMLQTGVEQKETAIPSPLAKGQSEKDFNFSPPVVASSISDSKPSSPPLAVPDAAVANSPKKILPEGSGGAFDSFADTSMQSPLQMNVADPLDHENSKTGTPEPTCGSPTIISSNDNSEKVEYQVGSISLSNSPQPASETVTIGETEKSQDTKERKTNEDDSGFTFEVQPLADSSPKDTASNWKPFPEVQLDELSQSFRENQNESKDGSKHTDITSNVEEDKRNQAPGRASRKGGTPEGDRKEKVPQKRARGKDKTTTSTSTSLDKNTRRKSRTEDVKQYPFVESSTTKSPLTPIIQTSSLPDLNSSISATALFQQPFTDLQQIQLRAQIFVYGSLIQGLPPDEACMVSAFGGTDGGKSLWESAWRAAIDRFQNQKSPLYHLDTPLHARSGAEQGSSLSALQPKAMNSPTGWSGSKVLSSAALSSPVSYTTPLWRVSSHDGLPSNTPRGTQLEINQAVSPFHQYPSPIRQYANTSAPWLSQSPRPSSWVFSGSNADVNMQYSPFPASEAVKITPSSASVSRASNIQVAPATTSLPGQSVQGVPAISVSTVETPKGKANSKIESESQKSRKRKKIVVPEELEPALPISKPIVEPVSLAAFTKDLPSSTGFSVSTGSPHTGTSLTASGTHPVSPGSFQIFDASDMRNRAIISEETRTHHEKSKLQAENASIHATSAVKHCQDIWGQLVNKQKSGLGSDVKDKLTSAAAAAAAAAAVAKAAAEAAKVASEAALQAKMMADEAFSSFSTGSSNMNTEFGLDSGKNMAKSTLNTASKSKGSNMVPGSSSVISSAREAARKRVEAASAATKQAENLDAIVKAAELAAEAVSHAGTIISMGDPLPFSLLELVEAGPEGYWKLHRQPLGSNIGKHNRFDESLSLDVDGDCDRSADQYFELPSGHQKTQVLTDAGGITSKDELTIHSDRENDGNGPGNSPKLGVSIKKGSLVEVAANEEGLRGVWFSARVLDVKEGKAFVCYKDLLDEGRVQLKEWIPLDFNSEITPRIRNAHPSTLARSEGTRKRRRDAVINYAWAVGDRVDAWLREGWWEGIVMEKCEGDETKLTVHFPAGGDSSEIRAWNLRPSLVWRDGQWVEWSRNREPYEGDTPNEKRQKHGRFEHKTITEMDGKNSCAEDSGKLEESRQLNLSDRDKIFAIGKSTSDDNLINPIKVKRIGLQTEGSRVVYGIPKPGKKRKFMEVSKHYTSDKSNKALDKSESMKFTQYLMPQSSNLQRTMSKVDGKGKQTFDSKARGLKSSRFQNNQANKGNSERSRSSSQHHRKFLSNEERTVDKSSLVHDTLTNVPENTEFSAIDSSVRHAPQSQLFKSKTSSSVEAETGHKGHALSSVGKSSRSDVKVSENPVKASTDVTEPTRRSNRRIQPTSRLLEGLQSSLIISKIPSISHDKGIRSHRTGASSRGHNRW